jgi:hypothetical protein
MRGLTGASRVVAEKMRTLRAGPLNGGEPAEIASRAMASWRIESSIGGKSNETRRFGAVIATPMKIP